MPLIDLHIFLNCGCFYIVLRVFFFVLRIKRCLAFLVYSICTTISLSYPLVCEFNSVESSKSVGWQTKQLFFEADSSPIYVYWKYKSIKVPQLHPAFYCRSYVIYRVTPSVCQKVKKCTIFYWGRSWIVFGIPIPMGERPFPPRISVIFFLFGELFETLHPAHGTLLCNI
jgi:hypothetical protein